MVRGIRERVYRATPVVTTLGVLLYCLAAWLAETWLSARLGSLVTVLLLWLPVLLLVDVATVGTVCLVQLFCPCDSWILGQVVVVVLLVDGLDRQTRGPRFVAVLDLRYTDPLADARIQPAALLVDTWHLEILDKYTGTVVLHPGNSGEYKREFLRALKVPEGARLCHGYQHNPWIGWQSYEDGVWGPSKGMALFAQLHQWVQSVPRCQAPFGTTHWVPFGLVSDALLANVPHMRLFLSDNPRASVIHVAVLRASVSGHPVGRPLLWAWQRLQARWRPREAGRVRYGDSGSDGATVCDLYMDLRRLYCT